MKKLITLIVLNLVLLGGIQAAIPQGMKYQAVARDTKGQIIADKEIYLKITLYGIDGQERKHYSEMHKVKTNSLGLFSIVIGEGFAEFGLFDAIPWSTEEIWMQIEMSDYQSAGYATISRSKLLAVPYAFAAGSLIGQGNTSGRPSVARYKITYCACKDGIQKMDVLYLGEDSVTIRIYKNSNLTDLVNTFTSVNNKDIITFDASGLNDQKFKDVTYAQVIGATTTTVTKINTKCTDYDEDLNNPVSGETFGNFSILSQVDKNGSTCSACEMKPDWKVGGNALFDGCNQLGTLTGADVVFITDNTERMKILKSGDITMVNSLSIGNSLNVANNADITNDLTVRNNVNLNTLGGATTIYGPLTVGNISPTILTGTLRVDQQTDLNNGLRVNNVKPTILTGTLRVDNATTLYSSLTVNNASPTVLTGTLEGYLDATLHGKLTLTDTSLESTAVTNGALVVGGGVGIGRNLNVGGDAAFGGNTSFAGPVHITDVTPSTNCTTGALTVAGGVGISQKLWVCDQAKFSNTVEVTGATSLLSTLGVTGASTLSSTLGVTGATTLSSTLAVTGATTLSSTLNANGQVTISASPGTDESQYTSYPLRVEGGSQGIAVKVTGSRSSTNNYVSFWDGTQMWGRIEGQTLTELEDDADYIHERAGLIYDVTSGIIDLLFATTDLVFTATNTVAAATSATACLGLGACVTSPIPSLIAASTAEVIVAVAQEVVVIADVAYSAVNLAYYTDSKNDNIGVSYQSGSGDYAEYLLRADVNEKISFGEIVGVVGGKISKNTANADKVMVVSFRPIVLGNMPQPELEKNYEKVAFMGQVPVRVFGKVNVGDYIIAGGNNDGLGIAVAPSEIKTRDIKNIVGIAWSASESNTGLSMINVAVGINTNDNSRIVANLESKVDAQSEEINDLRRQISETNDMLARLVPGFAPPSINYDPAVRTSAPVAAPITNLQTARTSTGMPVSTVTPDAANVVYHPITRKEIMEGIEMAEQMMKDNGTDIENHIFWKKFKSDPSYKEEIFQKVEKSLVMAAKRQQKFDAKN